MVNKNNNYRELSRNVTIEMFQNMAVEELKKIIPDGLAVYPEPINVVKINDQELHGIAFRSDIVEAVPTYYVDACYEEYRRGRPIEEMMEEMFNAYLECGLEPPDEDDIDMSYESIRKKLTLRVVDVDLNKKYLKTVPFITVSGNMALVCDITIKSNFSGVWKATVTNELLSGFEVDEDKLFKDAFYYAARVEPVQMSRSFEDTGIFTLTTKSKRYGAAALFYPGMLERLSNRIGGDYFVIPSSIHEVMIVPVDGIEHMNDMLDIVHESNSKIGIENVLSDNILFYDCEENELAVVDRDFAREYEKERGIAC